MLKLSLRGIIFNDFWGQSSKMFKLLVWGLILAIPGAMARKCSNCASGGSFPATLAPGLENGQIARLGAHFG